MKSTLKTFKSIIAGVALGVSLTLLTGYAGNVLPVSRGGTGASTKNFVDLTTDQTAAGLKTLTGGLKIGSTGTTVNRIWETTASINPGPLSEFESEEQVFTVNNVTTSDRVIAWSTPGYDLGFAFPVNARVSGSDQVTIHFFSRVSIDLAAMTYTFTFLRL